MSIPLSWVEQIFAKMTLVYGHAFLSRWDGLDLGAVKADWAHELGRFAQNKDALGWGLQNLPPERAPTVLEFRNICARRPEGVTPRLELPKADKEIIRRCLAGFYREKPVPSGERPGLEWARRIVLRFQAGNFVHPATLAMARDALGPIRLEQLEGTK